MTELDVNINDFEEVDDINTDTEEEIYEPDRHSPEWSDFVLSHLTEDEKNNGNPNVDGLRRMALKFYGPFSILPPKVHHADQTYAAVTVTVWWDNEFQFSASAEVHSGNVDEPFNQFPLATAETRAISRALRFALNLRKVVAAEEISRKANISIPAVDSNRTAGKINSAQIKFIDLLCKKNNISARQVIEHVVGVFDNVEELSYEEADNVRIQIDEWIKDRPDNVENYQESWR